MQAIAKTTDYVVVKPGNWGRKLLAVVLVLCIIFIINAFRTGDIAWQYVSMYLFSNPVMNGVVNTIIMTFCAMIVGVALGILAAVMRLSDNKVLQNVALGYIWLFRGLPTLLLLLLWFNLALIFPNVSLFGFFPIKTIDIMTPFFAALCGLGIQQGAYTAEVVRAGIMSIDSGQLEAAQSIGMTKRKAMLRIILPQAMRVIIPPIGNETIGMVKLTSLASVIQYAEVLRSVENIYYNNSRVIELLLVAAIWYMVIVTILSIIQIYVERHFSKGWHGSKQARTQDNQIAEGVA